ncbi:MAG: hypothetical protein HUJ76_07545, partial [Parasporobacterium sp.]|nr:hypothetical protein [Parasporobacterium sp.]
AMALCENTAVLVGSSQESGTLKNPLTYEKRKEFLSKVFPGLAVYPLPDIGVGNTGKWGDYVLENAVNYCGCLPDLVVSGHESRRTSWINEEWNIAELFVPKFIDISATGMIEFIINDDRKSWEEYIEPALTDEYDYIRKQVAASRNNLDTRSI